MGAEAGTRYNGDGPTLRAENIGAAVHHRLLCVMAQRLVTEGGFFMSERVDYGRYLASREWALLKEQVRLRCWGHCERCLVGSYEETHHLTYERIGHEVLDDLLAVCRNCHEFLSGKSDTDPALPFDIDPWAWPWTSESPGLGNGLLYERDMLICPVCSLRAGKPESGNLHIGSATHHTRDNPYLYGYGAVVIEMECEAGHLFEFVLGDHKGNVFVSFRNIRRTPDPRLA